MEVSTLSQYSITLHDEHRNILQCDGQDSCSNSTISDVSSEHWSDYFDLNSTEMASTNPPSGRTNNPSGSSVCSSTCTDLDTFPYRCDVTPAWHDEYLPVYDRLPPVRIHIRRNNNAVVASSLPVVSVCNMHSLMPKVKKFAADMLERDIDLSFLSEFWKKDADKYHRQNIEILLEMKGLKYISTPRRNKRGGGAAIVANTSEYVLEKINTPIPKSVEVVWGQSERSYGTLGPGQEKSSIIVPI